MELKVTFKFDASDSLLACVEKLKDAVIAMSDSGMLDSLPTNKERGVTRAIVTKDDIRVTKKEVMFPPEAEPEQEPEPAPASVVEAPKAYTEVDVRDAMDATRRRIEGEDYENKASEGRKKYHKQLTDQFKMISAFLDSEKPSQLPEDKRESFIEQCAKIVVMDDGNLGTEVPF